MAPARYDDFLSFAIKNEAEAAKLYERYAAQTKTAAQAALLRRLAAMERDHEARLMQLRAGLISTLGAPERLIDLHVADYIVADPLTAESSVEDLIIFAIKAEQKAFELYGALAALEEDPPTRDLLTGLAAEEKKHKYDLETEFEQEFLQEN